MRGLLKGAVEGTLLGLGAAALGRVRHRRDLLVLGYHNVVPDGAAPVGDLSLHLPQRDFAAQLDILVRHYTVVPLDVLPRMKLPSSPRPHVAITFDDAYVGAVTAGVAELARRGLPATIFVVPGLVGGEAFWWDAVAAGRGGSLNNAWRERALRHDAGRNAAIRERAQAEGTPLGDVPLHARTATIEQLAAATRRTGITVGSHTWSHCHLPSLAGPELSAEIARPLPWLREHFPATMPWLTYPYGATSPAAERCVAEAGYAGALTISGGWVPRSVTNGARFALPRVNVPAGISRAGFALQAAGIGRG